MSKSKGNFLMLLECVEEFSADATRFALADAGDSLEDANFDRMVANQAVTYLHNEEEWIRTVLADVKAGTLRQGMVTVLFLFPCPYKYSTIRPFEFHFICFFGGKFLFFFKYKKEAKSNYIYLFMLLLYFILMCFYLPPPPPPLR